MKVDVRQVGLAFAIMADATRRPVDLGHIHGLSEGMYRNDDLFYFAATLLRNGKIRDLSVSGGDGRKTGGTTPGESWVGSDRVLQKLGEVGISSNRVIISDPITNSKEEAVAILKICAERKWSSVGSISTYYHGGRMLPYMVKAMQERAADGNPWWVEYQMLVSPISDPWAEILGSQGQATTTGFEASIEDAVKIEKHIAAGFAATFEDVIRYLRNRDRIVKTQKWI